MKSRLPLFLFLIIGFSTYAQNQNSEIDKMKSENQFSNK